MDMVWKKLSPQYWLPDTASRELRDLSNMIFAILYLCVNLAVFFFALVWLVIFGRTPPFQTFQSIHSTSLTSLALPRMRALPDSVVAAGSAVCMVVTVESCLVYVLVALINLACDLLSLPFYWSYGCERDPTNRLHF